MGKYDKPNFIIAGISKSATSSLAVYLSQHPEIYTPNDKNPNFEPRFFVREIIKNISNSDPLKKHILKNSILDEKEYFDLFNNKSNHVKYGENSVHYFNHPNESIANIKKFLGDIPIIIILRNPIDRLISNWKYIQLDLLPLHDSLSTEEERKRNGYNSFWLYKEQSNYSEKIKKFKESFSKIKFIIFDDFVLDPNNVLNQCLDFLEINNFTFNTNKIYNKTEQSYYLDNKYFLKLLKNPRTYKYLSKFIIKFRLYKVPYLFKLKDSYKVNRVEMYSLFKQEIENLEKLLDKKLDIWKESFKIN